MGPAEGLIYCLLLLADFSLPGAYPADLVRFQIQFAD